MYLGKGASATLVICLIIFIFSTWIAPPLRNKNKNKCGMLQVDFLPNMKQHLLLHYHCNFTNAA